MRIDASICCHILRFICMALAAKKGVQANCLGVKAGMSPLPGGR